MQHGNHLKHMLIAGGVILAGLLAFGAPTGRALFTAATLACPIGMIAMTFFMMRGSQGHGAGQVHDSDHRHNDAPASVRAPVGPVE
jgi:hypothetical protein